MTFHENDRSTAISARSLAYTSSTLPLVRGR